MKTKNWIWIPIVAGGLLLLASRIKAQAEVSAVAEGEPSQPPTKLTTKPITVTLTAQEKLLKSQIETALRPYEANFQTVSSLIPIDINFLKAVCFTESSGRKDVSRWEANIGEYSIGLMGILLSTARAEGFRGTQPELFEPKTNLFYGAKYLKFWLNKTGNNLSLTASSYNGGYTAYDYYQDNNRFLNSNHVNKVLQYYRLLKA